MIAMNPNKIDGYLLRAFAYRKVRMHTQAIADDTRALQLLNTPAGFQELGFPGSTTQFKKTHLPEQKAGLYVNRGLAYQDMGDHAHAIADFTAGIAIYPAIGDAYGARALSLYLTGQYAKALPDANKDVNAEPKVWHAYLTRGQILAKLGQQKPALADLSKAIALNPGDSRAYAEKSRLQRQNHDYSGEVNTWRGAAQANPGRSFFVSNLGWAQYLAGDVPGAIATDQKALKLPGNKVPTYCNLGLAYATQNNWPKASEQYQSILSRAKPQDRAAALADVKNALKKHPNVDALKKAAALLGA